MICSVPFNMNKIGIFCPQIPPSGVPSVMLQWRTASTPGDLAGSSQMTPLLSISPPLTPWQTSWLFTGSSSRRVTCPHRRRLTWVSGTWARLWLTCLRWTRRRGTFLWAWQGSAVTRVVPKTILDACAEAGRRGRGRVGWHRRGHDINVACWGGGVMDSVQLWKDVGCKIQKRTSPNQLLNML